MAKLRFCILIGIGLLASGVGARTSAEALPHWVSALPDTSAFLRDARLTGHSPWSRRQPGGQWPRDERAVGGADVDALESTGHHAGAPSTRTPVTDPNLWGADGNVLDIARSGNTLYIAGSFRSVGENSGGLVPVDARSGDALRPFPKVAGSVHAIVPDGSGGWFIGGEFTAVAGKPRSCLAQIRADGSVTDWNPNVTGSPGYIDPPQVTAIAVSGDRVFVGGGFREVGGQPHENLGCVDARSGVVLDWNLDTDQEGWVYGLASTDSTVFVGGYFFSIGGQSRRCLAAVDAFTGVVRPWQADAIGAVWALLPHADRLYVAGEFGGIAGEIRNMLAAVDLRTGHLLPFDAQASGIYLQYAPPPQIRALALVGDTLYAAGNFTQIGGQPRAGLAMLNPTTGDALAWTAPHPGPQWEGFPPRLCNALAVAREAVFVGGWFETVGGESRPFAAALSKETGALMGWNPRPDLPVSTVVASGDILYLGGIFGLVGDWKHRAGLAAIDLTTGAVRPWNPNPDGSICTAIAVREGRVFVSGNFANIGGAPQPRRRFAALDTLNGEVTEWNPGGNSVGTVFLLEGDMLYVGGEFTEVGGQARNYVAAIDAMSGEVLPWNPNANWPVYALARGGSTIYLGGIFQRMGGQPRRGIAAVAAGTGALLRWNPDTDNGIVESLLVAGNTVYVGGAFAQIGGQPRRSLAALDALTGFATAWNPDPTQWDIVNPRIRALALTDSFLYVGGSFASIGGQPRICLAALDTSTGLATEWDPGLDGLVWSLAADGNTVYVGGGFTRAGGLPAVGLAAFSIPIEPPPVPPAFALAQCIPNPVQSGAVIRFSLPEPATVTLAVYDLQGRRIATLLDHAFREAGRHDVSVPSERWRPGVYLYRLEGGGRSATRKMAVIR